MRDKNPPQLCRFLAIFLYPQRIMKRLIKRYVIKAQTDKEGDEVNEGTMCNFCSVVFSTHSHKLTEITLCLMRMLFTEYT